MTALTAWDYVRAVKDSAKEAGRGLDDDELARETKKRLGKGAKNPLIRASIEEARGLRLTEKIHGKNWFVRDCMRGFSSDEITFSRLEKIAAGYARTRAVEINPRNSSLNPAGKRFTPVSV